MFLCCGRQVQVSWWSIKCMWLGKGFRNASNASRKANSKITRAVKENGLHPQKFEFAACILLFVGNDSNAADPNQYPKSKAFKEHNLNFTLLACIRRTENINEGVFQREIKKDNRILKATRAALISSQFTYVFPTQPSPAVLKRCCLPCCGWNGGGEIAWLLAWEAKLHYWDEDNNYTQRSTVRLVFSDWEINLHETLFNCFKPSASRRH